ncbi:PH domain-containing protein [Mucilaginibacter agri]|uniref:Uncharacterized protein YyaB-like PH domain-containing protein n=1 Tax=Mucilaginibacter agri TaxID=2695265 RepID=A0A965ZFD1_9SPHI|nr:PH domain-containing protein [Mucilaginibacter agri]NCD69900.1 hypothetical protein [Mucilaginibacter agri]
MTKTYPSKINYWVYLPLIAFITYFISRAVIEGQWAGVIVVGTVSVFLIIPMIFITRYRITDTILNVRSGFIINKNIEIAKIKSIEPNHSILSAPALSFDRIEIFYNTYDSVIISPKNKEDFIETLKQINPAIVSEV